MSRCIFLAKSHCGWFDRPFTSGMVLQPAKNLTACPLNLCIKFTTGQLRNVLLTERDSLPRPHQNFNTLRREEHRDRLSVHLDSEIIYITTRATYFSLQFTMPTELEELVGFIANPSQQIRLVAIENLVPYSTSQPDIFKADKFVPIKNLKLLVKDHPVGSI